MALRMKFALTIAAMGIAVAISTPSASAVTIESIRAGAAVTATSTTDAIFNDAANGFEVRCRHDIFIPTTAFTGTSSVSIEAANNIYSNCRDSRGGTCIVRAGGRWTITASSTTSGTVRLDSTVSIDCTRRGTGAYSCVLTIDTSQSLAMTFRNPVFPATTGTLRVDSPNTVNYTMGISTNCVLGRAGDRNTATQTETLSTENVRVR